MELKCYHGINSSYRGNNFLFILPPDILGFMAADNLRIYKLPLERKANAAKMVPAV